MSEALGAELDLGYGRRGTRVVRPTSIAELVEAVGTIAAGGESIYPRGGGTALEDGGAAEGPGVVVDTRGLNRVVDYPSGDMTITVEAGMTMARLGATLAEWGQRLPLDAPQAERATVGGVFACNHSGPRRFGWGRPRDLILGVGFVTSDGELIRGGGRVVKNVAGYDFPRLLTGSLGTLGVIAELTLKVRPIPEDSAFVWASYDRWEEAATALDRLNDSRTRPVAIELLDRRAGRSLGLDWEGDPQGHWLLWVGYEGNRAAVAWQVEAVRGELGGRTGVMADERVGRLWSGLNELTAAPGSRRRLRANVRPSAVARLAGRLAEGGWAVQAHAGSGIVRAFESLEGIETRDLAATIAAVRADAVASGGNLVVESCGEEEAQELGQWGAPRGDWELMRRIRQALDRRGLMNPGRMPDIVGVGSGRF
ncbi:MAG: FAD-linked oxidase [Isosphaeraceae bacterium]|nr:MAG: FAD-linked oxidase [Isosphaeraceae bacterium]